MVDKKTITIPLDNIKNLPALSKLILIFLGLISDDTELGNEAIDALNRCFNLKTTKWDVMEALKRLK